MSEIKQSPFSLGQFQIETFFIKRNPVSMGKPDFDIKPRGIVNRSKGTFLLIIDLSVKDSNGAYEISLSSLGHFRFRLDDDTQIHLSNFFFTNAPAIVFPYIRSYIASVTALSGLEPVHLPLMNFPKAISEELKNNIEEIDEENIEDTIKD